MPAPTPAARAVLASVPAAVLCDDRNQPIRLPDGALILVK